MIILSIIVLILLVAAIRIYRGIATFVRAEAIIKHEQWEEEKMIYPN